MKLHHKEAGGDGWPASTPAVVLLHGLNGSVFNWRNSLRELSEACGCRAVAFDRPPSGLSERPPSWGGRTDALQ